MTPLVKSAPVSGLNSPRTLSLINKCCCIFGVIGNTLSRSFVRPLRTVIFLTTSTLKSPSRLPLRAVMIICVSKPVFGFTLSLSSVVIPSDK